VLGLAACSGPTLLARPGPGPAPYGDWVLDRSDSDDTLAALRKALPNKDPPPALPREALPSDGPYSQRTGGNGRGAQQRQEAMPPPESNLMPLRLRSSLAASYVLAPARLTLGPLADGVDIATGERHRRLSGSDPMALTDRYGTRVVNYGWTGNTLVVRSVDTERRFNVSESWQALPGERLELVVEMSGDGMKSVKVRSHYRRARPEDAEPPSEGPPPPG
jgi:hypothetical protein